MKRVLSFWFVIGVAGCGGSAPMAGDVSFGQFDVHAALETDACEFGEADTRQGDFDFLARFGADPDRTAYMVVETPDAPAQPPVEGKVHLDGHLEFLATQLLQLQACGCVAQVEEAFDIELSVDSASDGGQSDAGVGDGGMPDAGAPDGGTQDGGMAVSDGGVDGGPIAGLPEPDLVTSMEGTLVYTVTDTGNCASATCTLPCTIDYTLTGPRVE